MINKKHKTQKQDERSVPHVVGDGVGKLRVEAGQQLHGSIREEDSVIVAVEQPLVGISKRLPSKHHNLEFHAATS